MIFIFPQNYNFNTKLLGIVDYPTAIINLLLWIIIFFILKILNITFIIKISIFIIICLPFLLISILGLNNENLLYVLSYLFKYLKSKKLYLYTK